MVQKYRICHERLGVYNESSVMEEDDNGGWVTWEDVKDLVEGTVLEIVSPVCDCEKMCHSPSHEYGIIHDGKSWICPVHGYKRR